MLLYGPNWSRMVLYGLVWSHMVLLGPICSHILMYAEWVQTLGISIRIQGLVPTFKSRYPISRVCTDSLEFIPYHYDLTSPLYELVSTLSKLVPTLKSWYTLFKIRYSFLMSRYQQELVLNIWGVEETFKRWGRQMCPPKEIGYIGHIATLR